MRHIHTNGDQSSTSGFATSMPRVLPQPQKLHFSTTVEDHVTVPAKNQKEDASLYNY